MNVAYGDPSFAPALLEEAKAEVKKSFVSKGERGTDGGLDSQIPTANAKHERFGIGIRMV